MQKIKRNFLTAIVAVIALIAVCFTSVAFSKSTAVAETTNEAKIVASGIEYATVEGAINAAIDGDTIEILKDVTLPNDTLFIEKSITIDGNDNTFTTTHKRPIRIGATAGTTELSVRIQDLKFATTGSSADKRFIETRGARPIKLALDNVEMSSKGNGRGTHVQLITIGGNATIDANSYRTCDVTITNSKLIADEQDSDYSGALTALHGTPITYYGYAIMTFNPVNLTIQNTKIEAYVPVYLKGASDSFGSKGSTILIKDSYVKSINHNDGDVNSVALFYICDDDVSLEINGGKTEYQSITDIYTRLVTFGSSASNHLISDSSCSITGNHELVGFDSNDGFYSDYYAYTNQVESENSLQVSGGTYSIAVPDKYCAPGFVVTMQPDGTYGAGTLYDGRADAIALIDLFLTEMFTVNRYTQTQMTQIDGLKKTAVDKIAVVTKSSEINDTVEAFIEEVKAITPMSLDGYKQSVTLNLTNTKTLILSVNRYTDENKTAIETLFATASAAIANASDYAGVDNALTAFNLGVASVEFVPLAQVKEEALLVVEASKAYAMENNRYTADNEALLETYYATALATIESATTAFEIDGAVASYTADLASVTPMTVEEYKADMLAKLEAEKKALLKANDYSKEDRKLIEEYFESARLSIEQANAHGDIDVAFDGFSAQSNTIIPEEGKQIVIIAIVASVVVLLGALAVVIAILLRRRRRMVFYLCADERPDEPTAETEQATETKTEEVLEEAKEPETAPEVEEPSEVAPEIAVATVPTITAKPKTFAEKLDEADGQTKSFYEAIREELLSYKKVKSRISQRADSFRAGRKLLAKIVFAGKSIKCYMALEPKNWEYKYFHHRDESVKKSYAQTPLAMRVRSKLAVKKTIQLIGYMAKEEGLQKK